MLTFRKNGPMEDFCAIADNPVRGQRLNPQIRLSESGEALTRAILRFGHEKEMVLVRSHFTPEEIEELKESWRRCSRNGGVLVSPFISPRERAVMRETLESGGKGKDSQGPGRQ